MANPQIKETPGQRVRRFIGEKGLVPEGQRLVVAVSGGADSVCLLHILVGLREELDTELHVAHLNHGLRGAASEADADYVAGLARRLNVPATVAARDVPAYQREHRLSPEEAAREVRYTFLAEVARSAGAGRVAVGHTVDDHIETILMHLLRGSGTRGLRGLPPLGRWPLAGDSLTVIRPLLELGREETAAYCRRHRLHPRLDASNLSPVPLRNRIRHQLLPELKEYNPRIAEALLRLARAASDDLDFIDAEVARLRDRVARRQGETVILDRKGFLKLPPALKRHLLRTSIEALLGNLKDIETRHIEEVLDALGRPAGKKITLPEGLTFTVEYDRYLLGTDAASLSPLPVLEGDTKLNVPGRTSLPGWEIEAAITDRSEAGEEGEMSGGFTAFFDFAKTGDRITVRRRLPGDRFQPLGMGELKKLNQFMIDEKIPQAWRTRVPIVTSPQQIIWVAGWRIDERVKVTGNTEKILRLRFKKV